MLNFIFFNISFINSKIKKNMYSDLDYKIQIIIILRKEHIFLN